MTSSHTGMPGRAPVPHRADGDTRVVVRHRSTGNPSSMRRVADAMVTAGSDDGLPRLSGHPERGTAVLPAPVLDDHSADDVHLGSIDGGRVEHTWAEQSVATSDHDRDDKIARSVMFVGEVAT